MAVCREVDTDPVEPLLPVKVSFDTFTSWPVLLFPSIFSCSRLGAFL